MSDEPNPQKTFTEIYEVGWQRDDVAETLQRRIQALWQTKDFIYHMFAFQGMTREYIQTYIHGMANMWLFIEMSGLPILPDQSEAAAPPEALGEFNLADIIGPLDVGDTLETESAPTEDCQACDGGLLFGQICEDCHGTGKEGADELP